MSSGEITSSWSQIGFVILSAAVMLFGVILYVRIVGLRSFSKMSAFDFAVTVAMGSLLAAIAISGSSLVDGLVAAGTLLGVQLLIALGRSRLGLAALVDNDPMVLMIGPEFLDDNLKKTRVTRDDIRAKLREANVRNYDEVRYVVLESTGDVSVVHGGGVLEPDIASDVIGQDRIAFS